MSFSGRLNGDLILISGNHIHEFLLLNCGNHGRPAPGINSDMLAWDDPSAPAFAEGFLVSLNKATILRVIRNNNKLAGVGADDKIILEGLC